MLTLMDKAAVIKLHNEGNSNKRIAKELSISKHAVNKYVKQKCKISRNKVAKTLTLTVATKLPSNTAKNLSDRLNV